MKTIGTCKECKWWKEYERGGTGACTAEAIGKFVFATRHDFGCVHWEDKREPREDYPLRTKQDLEIADLKRENNAAFERIQELSQALVDLGFDPTKKANEVADSFWREWNGALPKIGDWVPGDLMVIGTQSGTDGNFVEVAKYPRI